MFMLRNVKAIMKIPSAYLIQPKPHKSYFSNWPSTLQLPFHVFCYQDQILNLLPARHCVDVLSFLIWHLYRSHKLFEISVQSFYSPGLHQALDHVLPHRDQSLFENSSFMSFWPQSLKRSTIVETRSRYFRNQCSGKVKTSRIVDQSDIMGWFFAQTCVWLAAFRAVIVVTVISTAVLNFKLLNLNPYTLVYLSDFFRFASPMISRNIQISSWPCNLYFWSFLLLDNLILRVFIRITIINSVSDYNKVSVVTKPWNILQAFDSSGETNRSLFLVRHCW